MSSPDPYSTNGAGAPVAFVEFKNGECAASAMGTLQGAYLLSSDRGPIRIEYAKSKMAIIGGDPHPFREVKAIPLLFYPKPHQNY